MIPEAEAERFLRHIDRQKIIRVPTSTVDMELIQHRLAFKTYWRTRSDWYWLWRLFQEFMELAFSLAGLHKHEPRYELTQIAGICANWLEYRKWQPIEPPGDEEG